MFWKASNYQLNLNLLVTMIFFLLYLLIMLKITQKACTSFVTEVKIMAVNIGLWHCSVYKVGTPVGKTF